MSSQLGLATTGQFGVDLAVTCRGRGDRSPDTWGNHCSSLRDGMAATIADRGDVVFLGPRAWAEQPSFDQEPGTRVEQPSLWQVPGAQAEWPLLDWALEARDEWQPPPEPV